MCVYVCVCVCVCVRACVRGYDICVYMYVHTHTHTHHTHIYTSHMLTSIILNYIGNLLFCCNVKR